MSKLNNIKAVKEMLGGEHKTQTKKTISFTDKVFVKREVGETWSDDKGQTWEQRTGYKVKVGKLSKLREELRTFPNCNKETCTTTDPGQADLKMKAKKLLSNAEAWLKQAEIEKEVLKSTLQASFVNEDGSIEEWGEGMTEEVLVEKIDKDFEKFRTNFIDKLKKDNGA